MTDIREGLAKIFVTAIRQDDPEVPSWEYLSDSGKGTASKMADQILTYLHENECVKKVEGKADVVLVPFVGIGVQTEISIPIEVSKLAKLGYTLTEEIT